ncbi:flagellar hook assembly protein FlgD [Desulfolucanica intricata]|uniref:flagellar hook assembly protein FlgD n=1 Tax=Desulfolucanica intricata TaxID=1285191 RepID=UPI00082F70BE|nr:flagellar hook capping FlgD N-terminal domain-containing protein [Desulfolucanica intricata]
MQVSSSTNYIYNNQGNNKKPANELNKDAFLQLFIAQLKNQDPLSPQDSSSFMTQMAQFSMMEQLQIMNSSLEQLLQLQALNQAAGLVGRRVTVALENGNEAVGTVEKVMLNKDGSKVILNGDAYDLSQIRLIE